MISCGNLAFLYFVLCSVGVCLRVEICVTMDLDETDMSWLTQEPSLDSQIHSFEIARSYIEEDINFENAAEVISLEEVKSSGSVLYDNVVVEDISSDDCIDAM